MRGGQYFMLINRIKLEADKNAIPLFILMHIKALSMRGQLIIQTQNCQLKIFDKERLSSEWLMTVMTSE